MKASKGKIALRIFVAVILFVAMAFITIFQCKKYRPNSENVRFGCRDSENSYIYFDTGDVSAICKVRNGNIIGSLFTDKNEYLCDGKVEGISYNNQTVYVVNVNGGKFTLLMLDTDLHVIGVRELVKEGDYSFGGIDADEDGVYITLLKDKRRVASVYKISDDTTNGMAFRSNDAPEGARFLSAVYADNKFKAFYSDGTASDAYNGEYSDYEIPKKTYLFSLSNGIFTVVINLSIYVVVLLSFFLIVNATIEEKSFVIRKIVLLVTVVVATLLVISLTVKTVITEKRTEDRFEYVLKATEGQVEKLKTLSLSKDQDGYEEAFDIICDFEELYPDIEYVTLCEKTDAGYQVLISTKEPYKTLVDSKYGSVITDSINEALGKSSEEKGLKKIELNGAEYLIAASVINSDIYARYALVSLCETGSVKETEKNILVLLYRRFAILWAVGFFFLIGIFIKDGLELRKIADILESIAKGRRPVIDKSKFVSKDYDRMWRSMTELSKSMERNIYDRGQIYKLYHRFSPLNLENLLDSKTVSDIKAGEVTKIDGVVGLLSIPVEDKLKVTDTIKTISSEYEALFEYQENNESVLLPDSISLEKARMLFTKKGNNNVSASIKSMANLILNMENAGQDIYTIFHKTLYSFSIVGNDSEAYSYVGGKDLSGLSEISSALQEMDLRLLVTTSVAKLLDSAINTRYIGYVGENNETGTKLYEVLDACNAKNRKLKLETLSTFDKALTLFYKKDFYLARNLFADVIKFNPEDAVARWYMFRCEKLLEKGVKGEVSFALLEEKN